MIATRSTAVVLLLVALGPVAGAAEDVVRSATRVNKKAMDDYDNLEFDASQKALLSLVARLHEARLDGAPIAATVHKNLGMIYFTADHDRARSVAQFIEALRIDPAAQLDADRATPDLQAVFAEAQRQVLPGGRVPVRAGKVRGLLHETVDEARAGESVLIRALLGAEVKASRVLLFYRPGGQEGFVEVPMVREGGEYLASIPGEAVVRGTIQYYLEVRDRRDRAVLLSGSAPSPNIISILVPPGKGEAERPRRAAGEPPAGGDSEKAPLRSTADMDRSRSAAAASRPTPARPAPTPDRIDDPLARERQAAQKQAEAERGDRGYGRMFVNLMAGTGIGVDLVGSQYEVAYRYDPNAHRYVPLAVSSAGLAWSPLHGALEIGVNIDHHLAISLIGRLEGTLLNNADSSDPQSMMDFGGGTSKATQAAAGLLRLRYTFGQHRVRPGIHVGVGAGQIRHILNITSAGADYPLVDETTARHYDTSGAMGLPEDPYGKPGATPMMNQVCKNKNPCYDNLTLGFVLASVGGSFYYDLATWRNGGFGLIADVAAMFAFGGQRGFNLDVQLGVGAHFL